MASFIESPQANETDEAIITIIITISKASILIIYSTVLLYCQKIILCRSSQTAEVINLISSEQSSTYELAKRKMTRVNPGKDAWPRNVGQMRNSVHAFAFLSVDGARVLRKRKREWNVDQLPDVTSPATFSSHADFPPSPLPSLRPLQSLCLSCPLPSIQVIACTTAILHRSLACQLRRTRSFQAIAIQTTMGADDKLVQLPLGGGRLLSRSWKFSESSWTELRWRLG